MFKEFIVLYLTNNFIILAILLGLVLCLMVFPSQDKRMTHLIRVVIPVLFGLSIFDWLDYYLANGVHVFTWWRVIASFAGYTGKIIAVAMILLLFTKGKRWQLAIGIPAIINTVVYTTMFYTKWNTWFDENNGFHGGPLRMFWIIVGGYYGIIFIYTIITMIKGNNTKEALFLVPVTIVIVCAIVIETVTPITNPAAKNTTSTALSVCLIIFYISLYIIPTKYDVVTGLFNRGIYKMDLETRKDLRAVVSLDINYLKQINDTRGHEAGDEALKVSGIVISSNAQALEKEFGLRLKCYRVGGDEFCILMFGDHDADIGVIDKLIRYIQDTTKVYGYSIAAGFDLVKDNKSYHDVIRTADAKMYENKGYMKEEEGK